MLLIKLIIYAETVTNFFHVNIRKLLLEFIRIHKGGGGTKKNIYIANLFKLIAYICGLLLRRVLDHFHEIT